MKDSERKAFQVILDALLDEALEGGGRPHYLLGLPRFFLMQAFSIFKRNGLKADYWDCLEEFLEFLNRREIRIDYRVRRKMERALREEKEQRRKKRRKKMIKGAIKVDFRHHKVLGNDY